MKHLLLLSLLFLISCKPSFEKDGGTRFVLEASNADKTEMDRVMQILTQRLNGYGVSNPGIHSGAKPELIVVEVPGKVDAQRLRKLLQSSAKLEFWETYENKELYEKIDKLNKALSEELFSQRDSFGAELKDTVMSREVSLAMASKASPQFAAQQSEKEIEEEKMKDVQKHNPLFALLNPAIRYDGRNYQLMDGPVVGMAKAKDTSKINTYLKSPTAKNIFGNKVKFLWTKEPMKESQDEIYQLVALKVNGYGKAALWDNVVEDAKVMESDWGPQISMTMQKVAATEWQKLTRENVGKAIAIVIDDEVYSYPIVNSEISGGVASISGNFSKQEAQDFASVLKAGSLSVPVKIVSEEVVAGKK